ncbi:uncharacterized protein IUM83_08379 [Phytophthora cinnamomi]|uniref:uncharacterized protein n=1 Tax=Phytophthora cinnamomi TaxID=4785 RepID=UPI003559E291|nr:hypothetical protein IUM83_08379 [Phytophthora cinnamomi]
MAFCTPMWYGDTVLTATSLPVSAFFTAASSSYETCTSVAPRAVKACSSGLLSSRVGMVTDTASPFLSSSSATVPPTPPAPMMANLVLCEKHSECLIG